MNATAGAILRPTRGMNNEAGRPRQRTATTNDAAASSLRLPALATAIAPSFAIAPSSDASDFMNNETTAKGGMKNAEIPVFY